MKSAILLLTLLCTIPVALAADPAPTGAQALQPVAFLAGEHEGVGQHPWGEYRETMTGSWLLGGQVLEVRTQSAIGGREVFADLRIFSHDADRDVIRMRQYAMGDLAIYDVRVGEDGNLVFEETAHEGAERNEWRYQITRDAEADAFTYVVRERRDDGELHEYVRGSLQRALPDPGEAGSHEVTTESVQIPVGDDGAKLTAVLFVPAGSDPVPAVVFSPGGNAASPAGYEGFGSWIAGWGMTCVLVAFNDNSAEERAAKFAAVADWLAAEHAREGSPLHGRVDTSRLAAVGHSRGGAAALLAATADARFVAALGIAPASPESLPATEHGPALCQITGSADDFAPGSRELHAKLPEGSVLITLEGMDHMLRPREASHETVRRMTAFLNVHLLGVERYAELLTEASAGVTVDVR